MEHTDYYDVTRFVMPNDSVRLRLVTYDGDAPRGTVKDIVEVGDTDGKGTKRLWNWFVKDSRLPLVGRFNDKVYPYRGEKTFINAAEEAIGDTNG